MDSPSPIFDIYRSNRQNSARFLLGKSGRRPLMVVGLNPNTATPYKSDITIAKAARIAATAGYDGFVMVNLYPVRCPSPDQLPKSVNVRLQRRNLELICELAAEFGRPDLWAAWGAEIGKRAYLAKACWQIAQRLHGLEARWWHFGPPTRAGHPRHPSRVSYHWSLARFDIESYLATLGPLA